MGQNATARRESIRTILLGSEIATVPELCQKLNCSEATIRTDLRYLEEQHLIRRIPGGAIAVGNTPHNLSMDSRLYSNHEAKQKVVSYAFQHYIKPDSTIIIDAGTTPLLLAQMIADSGMRINVAAKTGFFKSRLTMI